MTVHAPRFLALTAAVLWLHPAPSAAEPALELYIRDVDEVLQGDPDGTSIDAEGHVTLGPTDVERVKGSGKPVMALAADKTGYLLATAGAGLRRASAGREEILFEAKDQVLTAVTSRGGTVWFASGPKGAVQVLRAGKARPLWRPKAEHVWGLLSDGPRVLAVTGAPGQLVAIDAKGRHEVLFDADEAHLRSLARHPKGVLLGGGKKGIVYLRTSDGVRALYDSELDEVTAFAVDPDTQDIYAAVVSGNKSGTLDPGTFIGPIAGETTEGSPFKGSEVVRIRPDGEVEMLWTSKAEGALDLVFDARKKRLLIATGTGPKGRARLYGVETAVRDRVVLLARLEAPMATAMHLGARGELIVATAPDGALRQIGPKLRDRGVYDSVEQDLLRPATVGRTWFDALTPRGSKVSVQLRTGNTRRPDTTWSKWSKPVFAGWDGGGVRLPRGRYAQFRATLTAGANDEGPRLRSMHASVRRANLPPRIKEVFALKSGVYMRPIPSENQVEKSTSINDSTLDELKNQAPTRTERLRVRAGLEPGARTIAWKVSDGNGDALLYSVSLVDERGLKVELGRHLEQPFVTFDASSYPDGRYRALVQATDRPSNPPETARVAEARSELFLIDHGAPALTEVTARKKGRGLVFAAVGTDAFSRLAVAQVSIDGGPWISFPAKDGLTDARTERFELEVPDVAAWSGRSASPARTAQIRLEDAFGNRATVSVPIPR